MESGLTLLVDGTPVSALLTRPDVEPWCGYVVAHGAGAGMRHPFLADLAASLAERGMATLRYQFPYMESGRGRVDPPPVAHATVRAAVACAARELGDGVPLIAGGKSFGGRMTSEAQAGAPLPGVSGLAFLGFPLHPPAAPGTTRAAHLARVRVPMLFLQGTRDEFAGRDLLEPLVSGLGALATLRWLEDGNHSFVTRKKVSGITSGQVRRWIADEVEGWARGLVTRRN